MNRALVLDPTSDARWQTLVDQAPQSMIFHHPAWIEHLRRVYRYDFHALCLERDGAIVAGLPIAEVVTRLTGRRLVALPFSDACPPLTLGDTEDIQPQLGRALGEHRDRLDLPLEVRSPIAIPGGVLAERFFVHTIDLAAAPSFSSAVRRNVRKAQRAGVIAERRTDEQALDVFYRLHAQTRRRQGVPVQRRRFVRELADVFAQGLGFVALARTDRSVVAAAVFAGAGSTLTYKFGASDRASLGLRPNNLLFASVIEWARDEGYRRLDLGRTDLDNHGLRSFKLGWGAREEPLAYTYVAREPPASASGRSRELLAEVVRRSPTFVGRGIGAALYRHVG